MMKNKMKKAVGVLISTAIAFSLCLGVSPEVQAEEKQDLTTVTAIAGVDTMVTSDWSVSGETVTINNLNVNSGDYAEFCIWSGDKDNAGYGKGTAKLVIKGDCYIKTLVIDCPVEVTCEAGAKLVVGELVVNTMDQANGKLTYVGGTTYNETTKTFTCKASGETTGGTSANKPSDNNTSVTTSTVLKNQIITTAKVKSYKASKLKKKKATISLKAKTTGDGKLSYKVTKGKSKYISVTKSGKVTLKKKCKKGIYKITITAKATSKYKKATKVVTIKVK